MEMLQKYTLMAIMLYNFVKNNFISANENDINSCLALHPEHILIGQSTKPPYTLDWLASGVSDEAIIVSIRVTDPLNDSNVFRGFVLQAQDKDTQEPIGDWLISSEIAFTPNQSCKHLENLPSYKIIEKRQKISAIWSYPVNYEGTVHFVATIIKSPKIFWENVTSLPLQISNGQLEFKEYIRLKRENRLEGDEDNKEYPETEQTISTTPAVKPSIIRKPVKSQSTSLSTHNSHKGITKKLWTTIRHGTTTKKGHTTTEATTINISTENSELEKYTTEYGITMEESITQGSSKEISKGKMTKNNYISQKTLTSKSSSNLKSPIQNRNGKGAELIKIENITAMESVELELNNSNDSTNYNTKKLSTKKQLSNYNPSSTLKTNNVSSTSKNPKEEKKQASSNRFSTSKVTEKLPKGTVRPVSSKLNVKDKSLDETDNSLALQLTTVHYSSKIITSRSNLPSFQYTIPKRTTIASRTVASIEGGDLTTIKPYSIRYPIKKIDENIENGPKDGLQLNLGSQNVFNVEESEEFRK